MKYRAIDVTWHDPATSQIEAVMSEIEKRTADLHAAKITHLYRFEGLKRTEVEEAECGDIVCVSGVEGLNVGETACSPDCVEPMPFVRIDEPTVSMLFMVNDSPFAGREGKYVTSRNLRDRLYTEVKTNVSMRVEDTETTDAFRVSGRGELHLSILIEQMRRQGYEFAVSRPKVILKKDESGNVLEPVEELTIDVPNEFVGAVMEKLGPRKGEVQSMNPLSETTTRLVYHIPSRGLMGYRGELMTDTKGNGVMSAEAYINPVPAGLVLTGIVVSVSVTAMMLSLTVRLYKRYHTLYLDDIYVLSRHQTEDR